MSQARRHSRSMEAARCVADGLRAHRSGQIDVARARYLDALRHEPAHADALHLLGVLAHQADDHVHAIDLIRKAITSDDQVAYYHNNLGECWRKLKDYGKAEACYRRALELDPKLADAHANLGTVFKERKQFADAIQRYKVSLGLRPNDPRNLANLGSAFCESKQYEEAVEVCRQATELAPGMFEGWIGLGVALRELGRFRAALEVLKRAAALRPRDVLTLNNLGLVFQRLGAWKESVQALQTAVQIDPQDTRAYLHLGNVWRDLGRFERAKACYEAGLNIQPDAVDLTNNLGLAVKDLGRLVEAERVLRHALALAERSEPAWNNLGSVLRDMGRVDDAITCYRKAAEFGGIQSVAWNNVIFTMQFSDRTTASDIGVEAQGWGDRYIAALHPRVPPKSEVPPSRRLRIGYVSPDLRAHPVAYFLIGLLEHHDRQQWEIVAYFNGAIEDDWTRTIREKTDHWVSIVGLSDEEADEKVRRDGIDVLIDLAGHTLDNRLGIFARAPARLQVTYLGYPGTTGLRTIDLRLSDRWSDPPGDADRHGVERVGRLPRCAWCYTPRTFVVPRVDPPMTRNGYVTFGCFNNYAKVSDTLVDLWAQILRTLPNARLLLKAEPFGDPEFVGQTRARFATRGISADQLILRGRVPNIDQHFATYDEVDVALDTYPYHGTTTTCDSLWMGVPVVTLAGDRHSARVGVSLLTAVGLDELIAATSAEYRERCVKLAASPQHLSDLRRNLRARMQASELMDPATLARSIEDILLAELARR